jgi:hypothetical protein
MRVPGLVSIAALLFTASASAHPPSGIVVDRRGQVFFTDDGGGHGLLWRIDAAGKLTAFHESGGHWLALDEEGRYASEDLKKWFAQRIAPNFGRVPLSDGKGALLLVDGAPITLDGHGSLCWAKGNLEIACLSPLGSVTVPAAGLKPMTDKLGGIKGLATGPDGAFYATCPTAVLKIEPDGAVTKLAALEVADAGLRGLAVDSRGAVYAAGTGCRCVVKVTPDGKAKVVLKAEAPWAPTGVAVHGDDAFVLEYANANSENHLDWHPRVRKIGRDGKVTSLATIAKRDRAR